jgi:hypothetical protein
MLCIEDFFGACSGLWKTERVYHYPLTGEVERSYTEFQVEPLTAAEKHLIVAALIPPEFFKASSPSDRTYGFGISFETLSETGEEVSMRLKALFVPDHFLVDPTQLPADPAAPGLPLAAALPDTAELIKGCYLRDEGYSESGAITGRFTYLPSRQTLEMTTYYSRSVAVDQMRLLSPQLRLRTIVTYQRPAPGVVPSTINLVGFGMERRED